MTRRYCEWCGRRLRGAARRWCRNAHRQAGFQAAFREAHGESYRAHRVRTGKARYIGRRLRAA